MTDLLLLGIDAGGSSCRARLALADGRVLGEGRGGPASARLGVAPAFDAMMEAVRGAWGQAGLGPPVFSRVVAAAGVAGFRREGAAEAFAGRPHPFADLAFTDDGTIACLGAHGGAEGGVVVIGTGSIAVGLLHGQPLRFGGYGLPASDEGSGARLGQAAMAFAFEVVDGRRLRGSLAAAILERFADSTPAMTGWMERASPADYAGLAPLVLAAAPQDEDAAALLMEAGRGIGGLVDALAGAGCRRIALLGGLAEPLRPFLPEASMARLAPALGDALDGALGLAKARLAEMSGARRNA